MSSFVVSPAAPHELLSACRLLFADGRAEHCRDRVLSDADTSGLFVARDADGKLRAAALVQALPGALGVAWPPRGDSADALDAVTAAVCEWLRARGVKVCQAFATASETADVAPLERYGFRHTTQLVFMRRDIDPERDHLRSGDWVDGAYFHPSFRDKFASALLATHSGTFDCPELNGNRTIGELMAGFELPESPVASSWHFLAESEGHAVGVVMMSPADGALELSYLGVMPSARGRGFGDKLVRFVFHQASPIFDTVTLSVDARNALAMRLYARHGFIEYDRREVWLATWPA